MPSDITRVSLETGPESNIHPDDYAGFESCRKCHEQNYDDWAEHPHRWMNAKAGPATIKGSFTEKDEIEYLGGRATFRKTGESHRMILQRDGTRLVYTISQTLGSRFFQY